MQDINSAGQRKHCSVMLFKTFYMITDRFSDQIVSQILPPDLPMFPYHYCDVILGAMTSQINSFTIVYSAVHSGAIKKTHLSSSSLAFVRGIHRWPVNSPHKWPLTRKMFPFDYVIMSWLEALLMSACKHRCCRVDNILVLRALLSIENAIVL